MNFAKYYADRVAGGMADTEANRAMLESAWDNALCAVQAIAFDEHGNMRPASVICAALSSLHTWNKEP